MKLKLEIRPGDDILAIVDFYFKKGNLFIEISPPHKSRFRISHCSWHKYIPCNACLGWFHYDWLPYTGEHDET